MTDLCIAENLIRNTSHPVNRPHPPAVLLSGPQSSLPQARVSTRSHYSRPTQQDTFTQAAEQMQDTWQFCLSEALDCEGLWLSYYHVMPNKSAESFIIGIL